MVTPRVQEIAGEMLLRNKQGHPVTQDAIAQVFHDRDGGSFSNTTYAKAKSFYEQLLKSHHFSNSDLIERIGSAALMQMVAIIPEIDSIRDIANKLTIETAKSRGLEDELEKSKNELSHIRASIKGIVDRADKVKPSLLKLISNLEKQQNTAQIVILIKGVVEIIEDTQKI